MALARNCAKYPWGGKLEAFTVSLGIQTWFNTFFVPNYPNRATDLESK